MNRHLRQRSESRLLSAGQHLRSMVAALGLICGLTSCLQHPLSEPPPELRGIVITGPPPSFADLNWLSADIQGTLRKDSPFDNGATVSLWDDRQGQGYFTVTSNENFEFPHIGFDPHDNCFGLWADSDSERTSVLHYQMQLQTDSLQCVQPQCSIPDTKGVCVCLQVTTAGCPDPMK